jgi:hypothetical protein
MSCCGWEEDEDEGEEDVVIAAVTIVDERGWCDIS